MSINLRILLLLFSLLWIIALLFLLRKGKIPVKYSVIWFITTFVIMLVSMCPLLVSKLTHFLGFKTSSNMLIGIILTLLLFITLILTMIVSTQKFQIKSLIQEVSILKGEKNDEK